MDETTAEKIGRIDANVKILLQTLPSIQKLEEESAVNKREHRIFLSIAAVIGTPALLWVCKKLGIPIF